MEKTITKRKLMEFEKHLRHSEKSAATVEKYLRDVTAFVLFADGQEIRKETVLAYKEQIKQDYKPASVNSMLSSLNAFFVFLRWYDCKVELLRIQRQIFSDKNKELTKAEYFRIVAAAKQTGNVRLALLVQTVCATGIRVSELAYITVGAVKRGIAEISNKGKIRTIIIPRQLCKMLLAYIKERNITSGAVFVSASGTPLNRSNIWRDMKRLCQCAGVSPDKVFPHNLRHLFARTYYAMEKDIVKLADILGHSKTDTTRIYTMSTVGDQYRRIERLGLLC